jgi:hypothetical protein
MTVIAKAFAIHPRDIQNAQISIHEQETPHE